ncbi:hypothetical protein Scep_007260 [Stephania cephalantha]|uniref:Uncharacterized protein n=1 Tax=Stephania cephalantha TaxID=152367 RepID=A0AAP0KBA2_9MAGN
MRASTWMIEKWERMLGSLPSLRLRLRVVVGSAGGRAAPSPPPPKPSPPPPLASRSPRRPPSLPLKPSPSAVAASEALAVATFEAFTLCRRCLLWKLMSVREVVELYGSEKSFVVEVHRALSGLHSTTLLALER